MCDHTCGSGRYGDFNCDWRGHGSTCRYCFDDVKTALLADEVAKRRGGRVIMCDTHEPPHEAIVPGSDKDVLVTVETRKLTSGERDSKRKHSKRWGKKHGKGSAGHGVNRRLRRRLLDDR